MTIQELREKRAKAWDTARDFLDSKTHRKRSASQRRGQQDIRCHGTDRLLTYGKEIQRLERQAEQLDAELNQPDFSGLILADPDRSKPAGSRHPERLPMPTRTAFWNSIRNRNYTDIRERFAGWNGF